MTDAPPGYVLPPPPVASLPVAGRAARLPVRRIYCVGRNYVAHIREMKEADERDPPFFFQKPRDSLVPDGATIPYPADTADFQYEVELVAAIGTGGRDIPAAEALRHVFGYAIGIDLTRRDRQRDARDRQLPWEMGKSFDLSAPCGPVHPAAPGGAPGGAIALAVNGVEHQRGQIGEMIWSVPEVIAQLSRSYALEPGDLVFTGTPAGVGPLVPGDVVTASIEGLGTLTLTIGPPEAPGGKRD
ncbi:FAA hydrolase family protein [Roseomonas nepalensis]|uniref:FAA hydrolase family protein n=1 Tax=Muricoccus nepalensis TaxID=1854500 RepID=A0A502GCC1_9PROT|nr:fumarylacetoacetate hydrolase family protein [Roseomonas nepalensis]TPG59739.1 FAA hydrolase family protein [Roseomonas nepalensis]